MIQYGNGKRRRTSVTQAVVLVSLNLQFLEGYLTTFGSLSSNPSQKITKSRNVDNPLEFYQQASNNKPTYTTSSFSTLWDSFQSSRNPNPSAARNPVLRSTSNLLPSSSNISPSSNFRAFTYQQPNQNNWNPFNTQWSSYNQILQKQKEAEEAAARARELARKAAEELKLAEEARIAAEAEREMERERLRQAQMQMVQPVSDVQQQAQNSMARPVGLMRGIDFNQITQNLAQTADQTSWDQILAANGRKSKPADLNINVPNRSEKPQPCQQKSTWKHEYGYLPDVCITAGWNLWSFLPKDENQNMVFSPLAIFAALAPLIRGTDGSTNEQIIKALEMGPHLLNDQKQAALTRSKGGYFRHNRMLQSIAASGPLTALDQAKTESTEYALATGIYLTNGQEFEGAFGYDIRRIMYSPIRRLDFKDSTTSMRIINGFFNETTKGKIPNMIERIEQNTKLIIVSALYLKAKFTVPFDQYLTHTGQFTNAIGQTIPVNYMQTKFAANPKMTYNFVTLPNDLGDAVQIPLGPKECKQQFVLNIFRPTNFDRFTDLQNWLLEKKYLNSEIFFDGSKTEKSGALSDYSYEYGSGNDNDYDDSFPSFEDQKEKLNSILASQGVRSVTIKKLILPKFKIETKIDLKTALQNLGITEIFERGNFTKMIKNASNYRVSAAKHRAIFEVDEFGIEGAAATAVSITQRSAYFVSGPNVIDEYRVDRAFLFSVTEVSTDMTLFMGAVNEPTRAGKRRK